MSRAERIVVVGAGLAGLRSAERVRELGFDGELVIIGAEALPPYHRPALSKQLLTGAMRPNDLMLPAYRDIGARWRLGTTASWLVPRSRTVRLPGGEELGYDGLIIATGVEARRPNGVPYHDHRVMVMRTLPDALNLERAIGSSRGPMAVVGGGFTGCEIAASLRHLGREVTIIGRAPTLLGNVLGERLGQWLTGLHRDHGVDLALETSVERWQPGPDGLALRLSDGTSLLASCVVIAAGTVPATGWLRGCGLPLDNGIVCEPTCHVVGADDVVAAGDVAQWPNVRFDNEPRRVEHWLNAIEMGRAAAESLLAGRSAAAPFTPMPRFWTEQYGVRIQAAGVPKLGTDTVHLGTADDGAGHVTGYVREGKLMGVVGVDCPSSVLTWTESICEHNPVPQHRNQPVQADQRAGSMPAPSQPPTRVPLTRNGTGRHVRPTQRRSAAKELLNQADALWGTADSGARFRAVVETSSRWVAAGANGHTGPARPNGPPGPPAANGWPGPMESNGRMRAVETNGRPNPAASNPRLHPPDISGRFGPAYPNVPPRPPQNNGRRDPAGSNGRIRPADMNRWPGPSDMTGPIPRINGTSPSGPPQANGHWPPRQFPNSQW